MIRAVIRAVIRAGIIGVINLVVIDQTRTVYRDDVDYQVRFSCKTDSPYVQEVLFIFLFPGYTMKIGQDFLNIN